MMKQVIRQFGDSSDYTQLIFISVNTTKQNSRDNSDNNFNYF